MTTTPPFPEDPNRPPRPPWNGEPTEPQYYGYNRPPSNNRGWIIAAIVAAVIIVLFIIAGVVLLNRDNDDPTPVTPAPTVTAVPPVTTEPASPVPTTDPTPTAPSTLPTTPGSVPGSPRAGARDDAFLATLVLTDHKGVDHSAYWGTLVSQRPETVLTLGYTICSAYDQGAKTQEIIDALVTDPSTGRPTGIPVAEARWVRAASVVTLCPEHRTTPGPTTN